MKDEFEAAVGELPECVGHRGHLDVRGVPQASARLSVIGMDAAAGMDAVAGVIGPNAAAVTVERSLEAVAVGWR